MNKTSIEWTDYTWNPVTGCTKVSAGCRSCYAETIATRFWGERKFTDVQTHTDRLEEPLKNKKKWTGKKVFVCSMSDLFHEDVPLHFIDHVFAAMAIIPNTIFQVLTKRPERALEWSKQYDGPVFPLPNVWIGVSVENQEQADNRIPLLLQIQAAVRFLSCEPLLGKIELLQSIRIYISNTRKVDIAFSRDLNNGNLSTIKGNHRKYVGVDWVIAGGESGRMARPMHPDWLRTLRDQCKAANVPFFFKQWGQWLPHCQTPIPLNAKYKVADDMQAWYNLGKSKSGNVLDGKQHLEFPHS